MNPPRPRYSNLRAAPRAAILTGWRTRVGRARPGPDIRVMAYRPGMVARVATPPLHLDAQEMLTALLRMDTTNPPGNERPAVDYLAGKLREVGIEPTILESAP